MSSGSQSVDSAYPQPLQVAIIGGGFSGICMGVRLKQAGIDDFRIFEKTDGIGGTWWDNTYPGAACDVPSHLYSFSFALNPQWSHVYSRQDEIHGYANACVDAHGLRPHFRHRTTIASARFDDTEALWRLRTDAGEEVVARVLISGIGALNRPLIPDIAGLDAFQGETFHSARWDHDCALDGRRVAIIGSAASAIQIAPQIAPRAARLEIFQRTANYVLPRDDRSYTAAEKARFARNRWLMRLYRWMIYWRMDLRFLAFRRGSRLNAAATRQALGYMRSVVADPELQEKLVPDYPLGCKRILISDDFYPCLNRDNVNVVTAGIDRVVGDGVITRDGVHHPADVLVLATGFRATDFLEALDLAGRDGLRLADAWRGGMAAYRGVAVAGFPNFFMLLGPNTGLGHNSIIFMIEQQVEFVMKCLRRLNGGRYRYVDVRGAAQQAYNRRIQADLRHTFWAADCASWYKTPDGRIPTLWPHSCWRYWQTMRRPRFADFQFMP